MARTNLISGMLNSSEASRSTSRAKHRYPSFRATFSATSLPLLYEPLEIVIIAIYAFLY